jgi:hypothetical protein
LLNTNRQPAFLWYNSPTGVEEKYDSATNSSTATVGTVNCHVSQTTREGCEGPRAALVVIYYCYNAPTAHQWHIAKMNPAVALTVEQLHITAPPTGGTGGTASILTFHIVSWFYNPLCEPKSRNM